MKKISRPAYGVVVLYNESHSLIKGEPEDMLADNEVIACAAAVAEALSEHYEVVQVPVHTDVEVALAPYPPSRWVVFNLAEGLDGKLFEEARIAWALEAMGYCFTGNDGDAIAHSTHKALTKRYLERAGLPTPKGWMFRDATEVDGIYSYPLIVKPVAEDGSLGIGDEAVVHDLEALRNKVAYVTDRYCQVALAEEFIPGREFNVALWGPPAMVLPLAEIDFSDFTNPDEQIISYGAKWLDNTFAYHHTPGICPALVNEKLATRIKSIALGAWHALGCRGYVRVDMRITREDLPYIIEVNCNPDIAADAGFFRAARALGYDYQKMVLQILKYAIKDFQKNHDRSCRKERWRTGRRPNR
ncbi:MAG: ATP-grasp domain-containing protein [Anaerolineales bacterium]|nr:ATP-grasp domain-containing protein [Anaerolineales bacterium]